MQEKLENISGSRLFFASLTFSWLASKIIDVRNQAIVLKKYYVSYSMMNCRWSWLLKVHKKQIIMEVLF